MEKNYTDFPIRTSAQHLIKIRTAHLEGHTALLMDWGIYTHQLKWPLLSASLIHSHPSCYLCAHTANSAPCTTPSPACCSQVSFERQQAKLGFAPVMQVQIIGQRNSRSMTFKKSQPSSSVLMVGIGVYWGIHSGDYLQTFFKSKYLLLSPLSHKPTHTSCGDSCKHCNQAACKKQEALPIHL